MKGFRRPRPVVLSDSAVIPSENIVSPAPASFTHTVTREAPYYYSLSDPPGAPDGVLPAGTKVALRRRAGGKYSWVVDGRGLSVAVDHASLKKL